MEQVCLTMLVHGVVLELRWEKTLTISTALEHSERLDQVYLTISAQHRTEFPQTPVLTVAIADKEVAQRVSNSIGYRPQELLPVMIFRPQHAGRKLIIRLDEEQPLQNGQALTIEEGSRIEIFVEEYGGNPRVSISAY